MIELYQVSKRFGRQKALERVTLKVGPGEIVFLTGQNGSGKTTLLKIVAGLLVPDEGRVAVNGLDPQKSALEVKRFIGLLPGEDRGFYGRLTGRQNLDFFGALYGLTASAVRGRMRDLAESLGLADVLGKPFQTLSSGERQRLSLARLLLHGPPILLLDEPMRNLDSDTQKRFWEFVAGDLVRGETKAILWATHRLPEQEAAGGRILRLTRGRLE